MHTHTHIHTYAWHLQVPDARMPSLSSGLPVLKPFVPFSTRKAEIPLCFADLSDVAKTTAASAVGPFVIQFFVPLRT
jgi:hypothetical protein